MYKINYNFVKRVADFNISLLALTLFFPLFFLISFAILISSKGPVFYSHERLGKNGKIFQCYKFRTMKNIDYEIDLSDAERLTSFGKFLRKYSLDELPSFFNVLKGDMSIVGPRPLLIQYLPLYSKFQARRHEVLPGITGWAQINGRNSITWDEKFSLDVWYVDNHNLIIDIKIIIKTFLKVINKTGIDDDHGVGQDKFKGNAK